ncbi:phosphoribosylglycinamide formyltransferase [Fodinibius sediminis]|uniref:Phosphoribosylglycinamide formyltransferase n=1 Tax=Fodinibius sediminis TaxID=1214077 RepID=A0A521E2Q4_9BACT|nr:phosphoribosylglycinamide formyltransferase [Fodinibius sediminis]SMO77380.1 formyltetrahydrofolate-dependent phosphoribosylglycinamide formyltransferase [Fodinibius sediminis]
MINIVVFASGSGTNFQSIIDAAREGQINGRIQGLITNKNNIKAIERARKHGISHITLNPADFATRTAYVNTLLDQLAQWQTDLIVLAGYMIKIPPELIEEFENRIINIHPSLLPKYGGKGFYGLKVHRAVIANGEKESGCSVHLVTEEYDDGPILAQRRVPVYASDDPPTLAERILKEEHQLLPEVIAKLANELNSKN